MGVTFSYTKLYYGSYYQPKLIATVLIHIMGLHAYSWVSMFSLACMLKYV